MAHGVRAQPHGRRGRGLCGGPCSAANPPVPLCRLDGRRGHLGPGAALLPARSRAISRTWSDGTAIRVETLGKKYAIGQPAGYDTLRDSRSSREPAGRLRQGHVPRHPQNRSGHCATCPSRSTRATSSASSAATGPGRARSSRSSRASRRPTTGTARSADASGALLEVGTGFHPELTGRENIYLNGAILGMRRAEIDRAVR